MQKASATNPVVAYLLLIRVLHLQHCLLNPLVFYHLVLENLMAHDTFCLFDLPDTPFLAYIRSIYPQPQNFVANLPPDAATDCMHDLHADQEVV